MIEKIFLRNMKVGASTMLKKMKKPTGLNVGVTEEDKQAAVKEKVQTQSEAVKEVSDLVAKMTEVSQTSLKGAKPEIEKLAEKILGDLTTLSTMMQKTVVEHAEES